MSRMAVGPALVTRDLFFDIMEAYLKSDPKASDVTVIPDAFRFGVALRSRFVPIITMLYGGIDFDLSYAPISRYQTRLPQVVVYVVVHHRILIFWMITIFATAMIRQYVHSTVVESQIPF